MSTITAPPPSGEPQGSGKLPPNTVVISVLGGPGSVKGTQCAFLAQCYLIRGVVVKHLSIGELLRAEVDRKNSPWAAMIKENIREGRIGPKELAVGILGPEMREMVSNEEEGKGKGKGEGERGKVVFVLDGKSPLSTLCVSKMGRGGGLTTPLGFPRRLDQLSYFEEQVSPIQRLVVLDCPDEVLLQRLLGAERGRSDDQAGEEGIWKRIRTWREVTLRVVEVFENERGQGRCVRVGGVKGVEEVGMEFWEAVRDLIETGCG
jgi:UMP-CMP kinase